MATTYSFSILAFIIAFILVGVLANKAGRSVIGWLLLSFLITPFIAALVLYFINPSPEVRGKNGIWYLVAIIFSFVLFSSMFWHLPASSLGSSRSPKYTVAASSQTGRVSITSFDYRSYEYEVQVHNGTGAAIKQMTFRIVYYDKAGNQIDYCDKTSMETIDAGMTKRVCLIGDLSTPKNFARAEVQLKDYSHKSYLD